MRASSPRLHGRSLRSRAPSEPGWPTAAAATARFCTDSILPRTPAEEFAAAISTGGSPTCPAAATCTGPNSTFDDVSEPVKATPIQPMIGDSTTKKPPAEASATPIDVA